MIAACFICDILSLLFQKEVHKWTKIEAFHVHVGVVTKTSGSDLDK